MSGIGVITNPRSRLNKKDPSLAAELGLILGDCGEVHGPSDLAALDAVAERFRQQEIEILCVNGGDGTLHRAVTAMIKAYGAHSLPRIAILRGGTMNTIAKGMGVYGRPADILSFVVDAYHRRASMKVVQRHALCIDETNYGFLFGTGVLSNYLELYYEGAWEPGPLKAAAVLGRGMVSALFGGPYIQRMFRPFEGQVSWNGVVLPHTEWNAVAAGTVDDVGLGFRAFYRVLDSPGAMHALAIRSGPFAFLSELPRIFRAQGMQHPSNVEVTTDEMTITSERSIAYMLDGDFFEGGCTLTVRVGPALSFVVPS